MTQVTLPNTISSGAAINAAPVQGNFETLRDAVNGTIGPDNTNTGASGLAQGCFAAYRSANVDLAVGAQVVFNAEEFDPSAWFNTTTGYFTPLRAGYYRISWAVGFEGETALTLTFDSALTKNGVEHRRSSTARPATASQCVTTGSGVVVANGSTDYFGVVAYNSSGGAATVLGLAAYTWMQGELIGRS